MFSNNYNYCNNCGKAGHVFHNCKFPITSMGIILFRNINNKFEYLMIRRKDTLGFVEFMRGKYNLFNPFYMQNIFDEMTIQERERIKTKTFDELWFELWGENIGLQYKNEEKHSKEKYEKLKQGYFNNKDDFYNINYFIDNASTKWSESEWGFPKGRRNFQEKDVECALREFQEETGYKKKSVQLLQNLLPYEEIFTGSNMKSYKHKYFVGYLQNNEEYTSGFQNSEVSDMKWMTKEECMKKIRPYNIEKKDILNKVSLIMENYTII